MTERIATIASVFAASVFGLAAGLILPASALGHALQWQAVFLIIGTAMACRTYDLVFFLQTTHGLSLESSYRVSLLVEAVLAAAVVAGAAMLTLVYPPWKTFDLPILSMSILATAMLTFQGASQAYLRAHTRVGDIIFSVAASTALYLLGCLALVVYRPTAEGFLTLSLCLLSTRPLMLLTLSVRFARGQPRGPRDEGGADAVPWRATGLFLMKGQVLNAVKNNTLSIETLILGALSGAEVVAVYRVIRSITNLVPVLLNIEYQKSFSELNGVMRAGGSVPHALGRIRRRCLLVWMQGLPLVIGSALAFSVIQQDPVYDFSAALLISSCLATLPVSLQQASFAYLAIVGRFVSTSAAYVIGILGLAAMAMLWPWQMTPTVFFVLSAVSGLLVSVTLQWSAAQRKRNR